MRLFTVSALISCVRVGFIAQAPSPTKAASHITASYFFNIGFSF